MLEEGYSLPFLVLGVVPRVLGVNPRVLGVVPRVLGVVPRVLGVVPRVLGVVPRVLGVVKVHLVIPVENPFRSHAYPTCPPLPTGDWCTHQQHECRTPK